MKYWFLFRYFLILRKKILAWIKTNLLRTKNFNCLRHVALKIQSLQNPWKSQWRLIPIEKFKAIAPTAYTSPIFQIFFKKRFLRKSSKPGHGVLVLILQVEWDRNFDDIRTNFLQALIYYNFSKSLSHDDTTP